MKIKFIIFFIIFLTSISIYSKRVISLAPNITEILYFLKLENSIVGIDRFSKKENGIIVGDHLNINYEKIVKLKPDYIFLLKSEKEKIKRLKKLGLNVVDIDINKIKDILPYTEKISNLLNSKKRGIPISPLIGISKIVEKKRTVLVIIDRDKDSINNIYVAGKDSFIDDYLTLLGLTNVVKISNYPKIGLEKIFKLNPDIIIELTNENTKIDTWSRYKQLKAIKNKKVFKGDKRLVVPSPYLIDNIIEFKKRYGI